jgi:hypothetical protein
MRGSMSSTRMRQIKATLLLVAALVCFGPVGAVLAVGVMTSPIWLIAALTGQPAMLLAIAGGCVGGVGLMTLLTKIMFPEAKVAHAWLVWLSIPVGFVALVPVAVKFLNPDVAWLTVGAPVLATSHLVYLARGYLFGRRERFQIKGTP